MLTPRRTFPVTAALLHRRVARPRRSADEARRERRSFPSPPSSHVWRHGRVVLITDSTAQHRATLSASPLNITFTKDAAHIDMKWPTPMRW